MSENIIKIVFDGLEVTGEINYRSRHDIAVKMVIPSGNFHTGCHIPYFAKPPRDYLGIYGDEKAKELLKELHFLRYTLDHNAKELKERLIECDARRLELLRQMEAPKSKKTALRSTFKNGLLHLTEYQRSLEEVNREVDRLCFQISQLFEDMFKDQLERKISRDLEQQVLNYIRNM